MRLLLILLILGHKLTKILEFHKFLPTSNISKTLLQSELFYFSPKYKKGQRSTDKSLHLIIHLLNKINLL